MSWPRVITWAVVAAIVVAAVAIVAGRISSCLGEPDGSTVVLKQDPTGKFEDVHAGTYRPPSIPIIEKKGRSPLPPGVDERKVDRVVSIHLSDKTLPISIVELKTGEVLVERDSLIDRVEVVDFTAPFLSFEIRFGLGLSFGPNVDRRWSIRPAAAASIIEIAGTVRLPVAMLDTGDMGIGLETRVYHEIWAGAGVFWQFSDLERRSIRLAIHYTF